MVVTSDVLVALFMATSVVRSLSNSMIPAMGVVQKKTNWVKEKILSFVFKDGVIFAHICPVPVSP